MPSHATVYNIEKLIAEENDPKLRAFLILLNAINQSLISNTETTRELSDKLDAHLTRFEQKTAQGQRFWTRNGGSTWASDGLPAVSAANIAAKANAINTKGKALGVQVWDTTNNRVMVARGSFDVDPWTVADGSVTVTPA